MSANVHRPKHSGHKAASQNVLLIVRACKGPALRYAWYSNLLTVGGLISSSKIGIGGGFEGPNLLANA